MLRAPREVEGEGYQQPPKRRRDSGELLKPAALLLADTIPQVGRRTAHGRWGAASTLKLATKVISLGFAALSSGVPICVRGEDAFVILHRSTNVCSLIQNHAPYSREPFDIF